MVAAKLLGMREGAINLWGWNDAEPEDRVELDACMLLREATLERIACPAEFRRI